MIVPWALASGGSYGVKVKDKIIAKVLVGSVHNDFSEKLLFNKVEVSENLLFKPRRN